jgi:hypothetical protein
MVNGDSTAINNINATANGSTFSPTSVTASAITITINSVSRVTANTLTWQGIQVRPTAGTPLARGDFSESGTSSIATPNGTWGTLTELAGATTKLAFTTQPGGATAGSPLSPQPVVQTEDAFGNLSAVGLPTSETVTIMINTGTGTLQGTTNYDIGSSVGNGTITGSGLEIGQEGSFTLSATAVRSR